MTVTTTLMLTWESLLLNKEDEVEATPVSYERDTFRDKRNLKKKLPRFLAFREDTDMRSPTLKLRLVFPNSSVFKEAVKEYAIPE